MKLWKSRYILAISIILRLVWMMGLGRPVEPLEWMIMTCWFHGSSDSKRTYCGRGAGLQARDTGMKGMTGISSLWTEATYFCSTTIPTALHVLRRWSRAGSAFLSLSRSTLTPNLIRAICDAQYLKVLPLPSNAMVG